jgi:hypothetical protein
MEFGLLDYIAGAIGLVVGVAIGLAQVERKRAARRW